MNAKFEKTKSILISHREDLSRLGTRHLAIFGSIARNQAIYRRTLKFGISGKEKIPAIERLKSIP